MATDDEDVEATAEQRKLLGLNPSGDDAFHPGSGFAFGSGATAFGRMIGRSNDIRDDANAIQQGIDSRRQQPRQRGTPAPPDGGA